MSRTYEQLTSLVRNAVVDIKEHWEDAIRVRTAVKRMYAVGIRPGMHVRRRAEDFDGPNGDVLTVQWFAGAVIKAVNRDDEASMINLYRAMDIHCPIR